MRHNSPIISAGIHHSSSLVELAKSQAKQRPKAIAYTFIKGDELTEHSINYEQLDLRAQAVAATLQKKGASMGDRALLLYPSSLDFITGFLGCLYAGVIAVPGYPPQSGRNQQLRIKTMLEDSQASLLLSSSDQGEAVDKWIMAFDKRKDIKHVINTDTINEETAAAWIQPLIGSTHIAFLQYTSGSTNTPRGVMVSHGNLLNNHRAFAQAYALDQNTTFVTWLPMQHDMGLIGGVLQSLYQGSRYCFMTPVTFLQKPLKWLQAISKYKGTISGAPNFAYQYCVDKIDDHQKSGLDLSSWKTAINGAEPVLATTLKQFSEAFEPCGLKENALKVCYGLAENTLFTTGTGINNPLNTLTLCPDRLANNEVSIVDEGSEIVSCGTTFHDQDIVIVSPESRQKSAPHEVGEIWVRGSSRCKDYWNNPDASRATFHSMLSNSQADYLRTGDLGFIYRSELYVTGRLKDLIIVNGKNYYPQDIEHTAQSSHAAVKSGTAAAFSILDEGLEKIVILLEVERRTLRISDKTPIIQCIFEAVSTEYELPIAAIALVKPHALPKTTSGKVQRGRSRQHYLQNELNAVHVWSSTCAANEEDTGNTDNSMHNKLRKLNCSERRLVITNYLTDKMARLLRSPEGSITIDTPINCLGLGSLRAIELSTEIETDIQVHIPLQQLLGENSIKELSVVIADAIHHNEDNEIIGNIRISNKDNNLSNDNTPFPVTDIQQAYLLGRSEHFVIGRVATHVYSEFDIPNQNLGHLENALNALIAKHPMLRTVFSGEGSQRVLEQIPRYRICVNEANQSPITSREKLIMEVRERLSHQVKDPTQWPLFDIEVSKWDNNAFRLHVSMDMLITDGWSMHLFFREWTQLCSAELKQPEPLAINFSDYVTALGEQKQSPRYERAKNYWLQKVESLPSPPTLPNNSHPKALTQHKFYRHQATIPQAQWQALKSKCSSVGVTASACLLTVFREVLERWSESADFCVNVTLFNRPPWHKDINKLIGDFTSVNIFSANTQSQNSLLEKTRVVQRELLQDLEHRAFTGVEVLRSVPDNRMQDQPFVVFTSLLDIAPEDEFLSDLPGEWVFGISQTSQSCLDNISWEKDGELTLAWDVIDALFPFGVIDAMFSAYRTILLKLASDDDFWFESTVCTLPLEQQICRLSFQSTRVPALTETLPSLFLKQAQRAPGATALIHKQITLSYQSLGEYAFHYGKKIQEATQVDKPLIGIYMVKGWEEVVAVLAVHVAGAAYVPIDPNLPSNRKQDIIRSIPLDGIITQPQFDGDKTFADDLQTWIVKPQADLANFFERLNTPLNNHHDDTAYILFTSGTTGKPKGIEMPHKGPVNTISAVNDLNRIQAEDRLIGISALNFDLSVYDIYGTLSAGAAIVIPDAERKSDPAHWWELVYKHNISIWNSVPAIVEMAMTHLEDVGLCMPLSLRTIMMSGDVIPVHLPPMLRKIQPTLDILSLGGPTETSIWSVFFPILSTLTEEKPIPYGYPLRDQSVRVIDENGRECPNWVRGEIEIGGRGVANGYWNNDIETSKRFIRGIGNSNKRFRSGDRGRFREDGVLEILGRTDNQIQLLGNRIELSEIDAILVRHPHIDNTVTVLIDDSCASDHVKRTSNSYLVSYFIPSSNTQAPPPSMPSTLRNWLLDHLPEYMLPQQYIALSHFPLSRNGKLDRSALPAPNRHVGEQTNPENDTESSILKSWRNAFDTDEIHMDSCFYNLGGNSLIATRLCYQLKSSLGVEIPLRLIFEKSTVRDYSNAIAKIEKSSQKIEFNTNRLPTTANVTTRPLTQLIETGELKPVSAAALSYLPDWLINTYSNETISDEIGAASRSGGSDLQPFVQTIWETSWGNIAQIIMPIGISDLITHKHQRRASINAAIGLAQTIGAKSVSLTGLIPSATQLGQEIVEDLATTDSIRLTTGHPVTIASVILNISHVLEASSRCFRQEHVALVGLGSIGLPSLWLALTELGHPQTITLCDVFSKTGVMQDTERKLRAEFSFKGDIHMVTSTHCVPDKVYDASLIIAASSVPDIIDIYQLKSGTLIVDDSAPHAFNTKDAIDRFRKKRDILFTEGGMLSLPSSMKRISYQPKHIDVSSQMRDAHGESFEIMGCTLSSILSLHEPFETCVGQVSRQSAEQHLKALKAINVEAARLHCEDFLFDGKDVSIFRENYGAFALFGHDRAAP